MANIKSAIKRARQTVKRRARNVALRSRYRTYLKRVTKAIQDKNLELAWSEYRLAQSILDATASKGVIHPNKASRHKHRLVAAIKKLEPSLSLPNQAGLGELA